MDVEISRRWRGERSGGVMDPKVRAVSGTRYVDARFSGVTGMSSRTSDRLGDCPEPVDDVPDETPGDDLDADDHSA